MNVHDEFTRRVAADRLCRELARAIAENDTAALERLGMKGFGQYAGRLSELMTDSVRRELPGADDFAGTDFGAIMDEVAKPAHYAHHLVNEGGSAIQQALDRRNGVRLRVIEPEFNDGRLKGIVGEASESDSENAADNLATQLGTFVKDMGNVFLKQNAEQRSRAGFKVTVTRTGGAKCCPWCADRTGKWELANAPDGVFGCHDNCKCMVDYTNSKGTVRGRAVTRKIDGKNVSKWEFADKIPYTPPRVLTREEATARGGFDKPKRLTGGANGGILNYRDSSITDYSVTPQIINNMPKSTVFSGEIGERYNSECRKLLTHVMNSGAKAGTEFSIILDEFMDRLEGHDYITGEDGRTIIEDADVLYHAFHNHGSDGMLSFSDIFNFSARSKQISISAVGNLGSNFILYTESRNQDEISKSKEKYFFYLWRQSTKPIVQTSTGEKITFRKIMNNADGIRSIIQNLPETEQRQILKEVVSKAEEHIREGEKYGFKYYERRI